MDFHDGIILSLELNPILGLLRIAVSAYPDHASSERSTFDLSFGGVSFFSLVADLGELKRNEFAGTIVSLKQEEDRTTYIYLTGGIFAVRSATREIRLAKGEHQAPKN